MEEHPLMCYGGQHVTITDQVVFRLNQSLVDRKSLASALWKKDILAFRQALHSSSDVETLPSDETETPITIFELACQTPGCAEFIDACISVCCDVNKLNPVLQKRPIDFAVESYQPDNLAALLSVPNVNIDFKYSSLTPINFLSEKISDSNFSSVFHCIKLLVKHGADLNIPSSSELPPITNILKNNILSTKNKELVVTYLLENGDVDIDTHRKGEGRSLLSNLLPDMDLPPVRVKSDQHWDFNSLMICLENNNETEFSRGINSIAEKYPDQLAELFNVIDNDESLLTLACKIGLSSAVERMLRLGADVNAKIHSSKETLNPIKCACIFGNWKVLDLLLKSPKLDLKNSGALISIIVKNIGETMSPNCNYQRCFQLLLNHKRIDINQQDMYDCSALHYAIKFNNTEAILDLLKKGAFIGVKNKFNQLPISNINPKVLEKHFNSCITTNGSRTGEDTFEIQFDFTNLVPIATREGISKSVGECREMDTCPNEMSSIEHIAESEYLRHLLTHPLIASFLFLKWNRLAFIFYMNFLLCALFSTSTISYIVVCYNEEPSSIQIKKLMRTVTMALTFYITIRELSQFIFSPRIYLKSLENYLECALIALLVVILFDICADSWRQIVSATSILLISIEIFLLAGSLPFWSFSTYFVMLKTVTWSFFKSLSLYAIILLAFSLSFFTLLREPPKAPSQTQSNYYNQSDQKSDRSDSEEDGDINKLNKFSNLGLSLIKTIVMSTGEFEAASINFELNPWSYLIFVAFLFIISTVLLNLLNGLAVSDTQTIKSEAELTNYIRRCQVLARYEKALLDPNTKFSCSSFMRYFTSDTISVFKELKPVFRVGVKPNVNYQILIPDSIDSESKAEANHCYHCFSCFGRCSRMDGKIVKLAFSLLEKMKMEKYEETEKDQLKDRMRKVEISLEHITNQLNIIMNDVKNITQHM